MYHELEIGLYRRDQHSYAIELRLAQPENEVDKRLGSDTLAPVTFDMEELNQLLLDPDQYGQKLGAALFASPEARSAFAEARSVAQSHDSPLRVQLVIGNSAAELQKLHWETLRDPQDGTPLCSNENFLFSRYLSSLDWRSIRLRPQRKLSALVVIANPANLTEYNLEAVDIEAETDHAVKSLSDIQLSVLPNANDDRRATLENMVARLRHDQPDILYLICHGTIVNNEAWLWLENDKGIAARVSGAELLTRLKELQQLPRLVVLSSCDSAGSAEAEAFTAIGPGLAEAGIPAVIAMQGKVSKDTAARFGAVFFEELVRDGQIDRAMAVARGSVRDQPDYWMPVLFLRLKSGRIWYTPGFGQENGGFEKWPALAQSIHDGQCTPVLGPGLWEPLFGSTRQIAKRWAESYHYPMAPHERESLPQVAQFLAVNQARGFPYNQLVQYHTKSLQDRFGEILPPELQQDQISLDKLIQFVGAEYRNRQALESYKTISKLPLPVFITTNVDNLIADALREEGKDPQIVLCPWNEYVEQMPSSYHADPEYVPSPERPLVYHLFGRLNEIDSVVLTEDDYFDFLIGVTSNNKLIPPAVRRALTDTALLFLGFQIDDWDFRILFRSILSRQGGGRRARYAHIAAQIEPEEGRIVEPHRARRYLENYFSKGADISIFWGSAGDFLRELDSRLDPEVANENPS